MGQGVYHLCTQFTRGWWHVRSDGRATSRGASNSHALGVTSRAIVRVGTSRDWRAMRSIDARCANVTRSRCANVTMSRSDAFAYDASYASRLARALGDVNALAFVVVAFVVVCMGQ